MPARHDVDAEAMPPIAMGMATLTFLCFSLMDASAKHLVLSGLAAVFVVWCRFTSQAIAVFFLMRGWKNADVYRMRNPVLQIVRGLLLPATTVFNFLALESLQLAVTASIFMSAPIFVTAISGPILGEWAGRKRWLAIVAGFMGVLMVVRPGTEIFTLPVVWAILSVLSYSLYSVLTRKLAPTETASSLVFYSCIFAVLFLFPTALTSASLPVNLFDTVLLFSFGLLGLLGHTLLVRASRMVSAAKIAPFAYLQLIWMTLLGYFIFGDLPDVWTVAGALVISASGLYIMNRERNIARARRMTEKAVEQGATLP